MSRSRLPIPHSSPEPRSGPSIPTSSSSSPPMLKRKAINDEDADRPPRKLPAITESGSQQPLRPSKTATNLSSIASTKSFKSSLTIPKAPVLSTRQTNRATSAPPKSSAVLARLGSSSTRPLSNAGRTVSASYKPKPDDRRFQDLQHQVSSIESARAADAARLAADMEAERAKVSELQENHMALSRELAAAKSQEVSQRRELMNVSDEIENIKKKHAREIMDLEMDLRKRDRKIRELEDDLRVCTTDLSRERDSNSLLKATISEQSTAHIASNAQIGALQAQLSAIQAASDSNSSFASHYRLKWETAEKRVEHLETEVREAETVRRRLHNMVQELKGNIRVFARVRPLLSSDLSSNPSTTSSARGLTPEDHAEIMANVEFPDKRDHKEITLSSSSESATGQERRETWQFTFDRVFEPASTQLEVFEEVSQLAQSCTDGYNVCIFAYGQTGSGKSFTMEGGPTESSSGMIPRAVDQVFRVAEELKMKGWEYRMEGQFLEIYNETINDLLGTGEIDKKKHEIKHDKMSTRVTDINVVPLHSPTQVRSLLSLAQSRRTVAATLMNERSSRSHSVFTLRISGKNTVTEETCEGCLNLVDLAGSERLKESGAGSDKERLKETQSINKSLSALGDVIAALGEKGEGKGEKHIPYRNSKLTYLLQHSLSGNSKTLMVLNLSPLATHLNESLCSLRFATKVNNTTIGTAKKLSKGSNP